MWPALRALLSHWQRRPFQAVALLIGLASATALWAGIQAINGEARTAYDRAAALLGQDRFATLAPAGGAALTEADYVALRLGGWRVSPIIDGAKDLAGRRLRILGIDPLTLPPGAPGAGQIESAAEIGQFFAPPYMALAHPETAASLTPADLADLPDLAEIRGDAALPRETLLVDIGLAQRVLNAEGQLTRALLLPRQKPSRAPLGSLTDTKLIITEPGEQVDLGELTASFHLNLTAFGLLAFTVGLFIVHATIGLTFEQRRALIRTLRALGISQRQLLAAMALELGLLALLGGGLGTLLGYLIAAALLPDIAASLGGLYGADVPGTLSLSPQWWIASIGISLGGAVIAGGASFRKAAKLSILAPVGSEAWLSRQKAAQHWQGWAGLALLSAAGLAGLVDHLVAGFAMMAGLLVGAALLLPSLLTWAVSALARRANSALGSWFWADTRAQIGGLSMALMALLLALSVNIGVSAMVDGFRATFLAYLDKRLSSELYVTAPDEATGAAMRAGMRADARVAAVLPIWSTELAYEGWPVFLYGIVDHATYRENWPLVAAGDAPWDALASGGAMISEQFANRFGLAPGDRIEIGTPGADLALEIAGIYADYGNTTGQMIVPLELLLAHWPDVEKRRFGLRVAEADMQDLRADLIAEYGLPAEAVIDQRELKAGSRAIFERTFSVTIALNALTLGIAGLALFISLLTLAAQRLPGLAPAWALGVTRGQLARLELCRAAALALLTAAAAVPLGIAVAWVLTAVVNVKAFGWTLPLAVSPGQWLVLAALALVAALAASAWPALRLARLQPAALLGVFAHER